MKAFLLQTTGLTMLIACICLSANAQTSPLTNWDFSQIIELDEEVTEDSRLESFFIEDMLLVTHPSLDTGTGCGEALLLAAGEDGNFVQIQNLSAEDFGGGCDEQDGFGFSVDYADGLLIIGAPGQVFTEAGQELSNGNVYAYRLENNVDGRLIASAHIQGTGMAGNLAWGSRVKTDGMHILVQGNQAVGVETELAHNRALAQTVNLLESSVDGSWHIIQEFTGDSTIYGHDFLIKDHTVFINSHEFVFFVEGFINVSPLNRYNTSIEIYDIDEGINVIQRQAINLRNRTAAFTNGQRQDNYLDVDQLYLQNDDLIVFAPFGGTFSGSSSISWFEVGQENLYQAADSQFFGTQFLELDGQLSNTDGIAVAEAGPSGRAAITSYRLDQSTINKISQRVISNQDNQALSIFDVDSIRINASNDRLLITSQQEFKIFASRPALDPAITGLWWLGQQFNGQGITMEVLLNNRLLIHWFTYDLSGNQMWVRGSGKLVNGKVKMQLVRARGPRFRIGQFNPADRVVEAWGNAEITFSDCRNGQLKYQSDEFGSATLAIFPLVDNGIVCKRGFIADAEGNELANRFRISRQNTGTPYTKAKQTIIGSAFDETRSGEGFIFLPARVDTANPDSRNIVGLWLTYNQQGEQAWYYLGEFEDCFFSITPCRWQPVGQPRRPEGPVFGPAYDPNDRVITPWGFLGEINQVFITPATFDSELFVSVNFSNPDGSGTLTLQKLSDAIGY